MALPSERAYALPPSNSATGNGSKETLVCQERCTRLFSANCNNKKQYKCPLRLEWVNCSMFIHDIYKAVKMNNCTKKHNNDE